MKTAEILLNYMDWLQKIARIINSYADKGLEIVQKIKMWIQKIVDYIEQAIDALVDSVGGRKTESKLMSDDYLFV